MASTPASLVMGLKWDSLTQWDTTLGSMLRQHKCGPVCPSSGWEPVASSSSAASPHPASLASQCLKIHALLVAGNKEAYAQSNPHTNYHWDWGILVFSLPAFSA